MKNILEVDSVLKSFGDKTILTDIYLKCQTGDIIGLLGRNGTGKSTLMKILFGVMPAQGKFITINGEINNQPFKTRGEVAYLPQHSFLLKNLTVDTVATLFIDKESKHEFFDDEVLNKLRKSKITALSGGELRYLEIKLLLFSNNKFLLLDEPFNGVAPLIVEQIKRMITRHSETKGIILTDHDYNNIMDVANRLLLLYDGGLKNIRSENELMKWGYLKDANVSKLLT